MFEYKLCKFPLLVFVAIAHLLGSSLAPVRAASVNLDTPQAQSECPKSSPNSNANAASLLAQENSNSVVAQLPAGDRRPIDSDCQVSGEDGCDIAGDAGCEVGGPPPAGGGILPAIAAAGGGFPLLALAPLAALPFVGGGSDDGGGGGNNGTPVPPTEPVPEPSTVFGSVIALGAVTAIARKRKSRSRRK